MRFVITGKMAEVLAQLRELAKRYRLVKEVKQYG